MTERSRSLAGAKSRLISRSTALPGSMTYPIGLRSHSRITSRSISSASICPSRKVRSIVSSADSLDCPESFRRFRRGKPLPELIQLVDPTQRALAR